jgi:AraC family transcriptional regulator
MEYFSDQTFPSSVTASWDDITVEYSRIPSGEFDVSMPKTLVGIAFTPQNHVTWHVDGGSSRTTPLHREVFFSTQHANLSGRVGSN